MKNKILFKIGLGAVMAVIFTTYLFAPINLLGNVFGVAHVNAQATNTPAAQQQTQIDSYLSSPMGITGAAVREILYFFAAIVGLLGGVAAFLIGIAMQINLSLLQPSANVAISVGWDLFRQITNLGFVLGIIIVALATILRSRSYRMQQILPKLIVAALLVNFSLVIAGSLLNISDTFSIYFLNDISGKKASTFQPSGLIDSAEKAGNFLMGQQDNELVLNKFVGSLIDFSGAVGIVIPPSSDIPGTATVNKVADWSFLFGGPAGASLGLATKAGLKIANIFNSANTPILVLYTLAIDIVVLLIIALTLFVLAGQIFIRYFYLTALLIVSPIVWLMWAFPFGSRWWREWWLHFIKWTFMLPINLLFLWISLNMLTGVKDAVVRITNDLAATGGISAGLSPMSAVTGSIMALSFIILGMKLAHKIGISGSDTAVKWVGAAGGAIKDRSIELTKRGASRAAVQTGALGTVQGGLTAIGSTRVGRMLGVGKLGQKFAEKRPEIEKKSEAFTAEKMAQYKGIGVNRLKEMLPSLTDKEMKAAMLFLANEKKLNDPEVIKMAGRGDKQRGEDALFTIAEERLRNGDKKASDNVYIGVGKDRNVRDLENEVSGASKEREDIEKRVNAGEFGPDAIGFADSKLNDAKRKLTDANQKFLGQYKKDDEIKEIAKARIGNGTSWENLSEGEKESRLSFANSINSDTTGKKYSKALSAADNDKKVTDLLESMVRSLDKQVAMQRGTNKLISETAYASARKEGDFSEITKVVEKEMGSAGQKLANRIEKTTAGDIGLGGFNVSESGGGEKSEAKSEAPKGGKK